MRVIAGSARGLMLKYPKGAEIRPTSDRVRESLFASLGPDVADCRFCDLYAGAGSVGIEALSRGAAGAVFVERNRRCLQALRTNLANTGLESKAVVIGADLPKSLPEVWQKLGPFDIMFADPPYSVEPVPLLKVAAQLMRQQDAVLILQCERHSAAETGELEQFKIQQFGATILLWYRWQQA